MVHSVIILKRVEVSTPRSITVFIGPYDHEEEYRMKKYEIMYIVNAFLDDEARAKVMDGLHSIITDMKVLSIR